MKNLKAARVLLCIMGILMIVLGILMLLLPGVTLLTVALILGIGFLITGIFCVIAFFAERGIFESSGWTLVQGILDILIGVLLLYNLKATVIAIPFIVAFWMLFSGIMRISVSIDLKKTGLKKWWVVLVNGILAFLVALIMFFSPVAGAIFVVALLGAYFIVYGIMVFVETVSVKLPKTV